MARYRGMEMLSALKQGRLGKGLPPGADPAIAGLGGMPGKVWRPPPGAYGQTAPPVGSTTAQNQAASQAQTPSRRTSLPDLVPGTKGSDKQQPEEETEAQRIQRENRERREETRRRREWESQGGGRRR